MNIKNRKVSDKVGIAIVLVWFYAAMCSTICTVNGILATVYGTTHIKVKDMWDAEYSYSILILCFILPICVFGLAGYGSGRSGSSPSVESRVKNGVIFVCFFYSISSIIAGVICIFQGVFNYLKYGEYYSVSTLVWIEQGLDISVTWIGLRDILQAMPIAASLIFIGLAPIWTYFKIFKIWE